MQRWTLRLRVTWCRRISGYSLSFGLIRCIRHVEAVGERMNGSCNEVQTPSTLHETEGIIPIYFSIKHQSKGSLRPDPDHLELLTPGQLCSIRPAGH